MNKELLIRLAIGFLIMLCVFGVVMMLHVVINVDKAVGIALLLLLAVMCFLIGRGIYQGRKDIERMTTLVSERVMVLPLDYLKVVDNPDASQESLINEYVHLKVMVESLHDFIRNDTAYHDLDGFEQNALIKQWNLMAAYLQVLAGRMVHKEILVTNLTE